MHAFTLLIVLVTFISTVLADSIYVVNKDTRQRKVCFTPGCRITNGDGTCAQYYTWYGSFLLNGCSQQRTFMVEADWSGNVKTIWPWEDCGSKISVLGEVTFDPWWTTNKVWFDVSSIDSTDPDQIKQMYPRDDVWNQLSGCFPTFPCNNAYQKSNDIQTKSVTGLRDIVINTGNYWC